MMVSFLAQTELAPECDKGGRLNPVHRTIDMHGLFKLQTFFHQLKMCSRQSNPLKETLNEPGILEKYLYC